MNTEAFSYSYSQRVQFSTNPTGRKLLQLMDEKKTNLAVNIDVTRKEELLSLVECLAPYICVLKTHIDLIEDFDDSLIHRLKKLADKHHFLIFEDRKFADIGTIAKLQYQKGVYKIAEWAHITNAHPLPGPGLVQGLKTVGGPLGRGLLLVAEMSSEGAFVNESYREVALKIALENKNFVIGFVSQHKLLEDPSFIYFIPGINLSDKKDLLGQRITPLLALLKIGGDIQIVGRGIVQASNPLEAAKEYRNQGWEAYVSRSNSLKSSPFKKEQVNS